MTETISSSELNEPSSDGAPAPMSAPDATGDARATQAAEASAADAGDAMSDAQRELDVLRDKYLRLAAEFDNFRRRGVRERQEAGWRAQGDLVRGLLDALDDIQRFAAVDPATVDSRAVVDGVQLIQRKLVKSLAGHGFEVVDPAGQPFDPAQHEAVTTAPAGSADEDGVVAQVFQVGYVINGHVLRPARVVVKQWSGV